MERRDSGSNQSRLSEIYGLREKAESILPRYQYFGGESPHVFEDNSHTPEIAEIYKQADLIILGTGATYSLSELTTHDSRNKLRSGRFNQVATYLGKYIDHEVLKIEGKRLLKSQSQVDVFKEPEMPKVIVGEGIGLINALVESGSITFEDGLLFVEKRAKALKDECDKLESGLTSIEGILEVQLRAVLKQFPKLEIAILRPDSNFVIGGPLVDLDEADEILSKFKNSKVIKEENVDGAIYTRLMAGAEEKLREALANITIREPNIPVLANTSGQELLTPEEIAEELIKQPSHPIRMDLINKYLDEKGLSLHFEPITKQKHVTLWKALGGLAVSAGVAAGAGFYAWREIKKHQGESHQ